ncbi:hypothetical protein CLHUN_31090 [Ruminiclostridium hungatei]|uniref:DUF3021 family protein n=1 Tax=Ruminiclostridium hungatei TaxID=48256 RepID=A0A1V4SHM1_RUMHU|nr:hypothetical protein [Ruminiclostridium hungatei]OPX42965.1 hypothetical protein CLHUN_31090 [Ruminiclostridium hungatei]
MDKKFTIFDFFSEAFNTFSIMIICITLTTYLFGTDAGTISSLYKLGSEGIAVDTIAQFMSAALVLELVKVFWFSEKLIRNMMALWRTVCMVISVIPVMAAFAGIFGWFPLDNLHAWGGFLISFAVCFVLSLGVIYLKARLESRKYEEGFKRYRLEHGLEEKDD